MSLRKSGNRYFGEYSDLRVLAKDAGNELIYFCPYCVELGKGPDRSGHFYYNKMNAVGFCFRCEACIISDGLRSVELIRQQLSQIKEDERYAIQKYNVTGWTWPITAHDSKQLQYMMKRGISKDTLNHFRILACDSPSEGIIFCNKLFEEDKQYFTDFFQVRKIEGKPKYVNLRDVVKPMSWIDYIENESVMIVEGFISGMAAYQHLDGMVDPIVLGGKTISHLQVNQIKQACTDKPGISRIYVILDGGYFEESIRIARRIERDVCGPDIVLVKLPFRKDPNELDYAQFGRAFRNDQHVYTRFAEGLIRDKAYERTYHHGFASTDC